MATTGTTRAREPADLASDLRGADLVRVVSRADGDGLAGAAILGQALTDLGIPRHLALSPSRDAAAPRLESDGTAVALGFENVDGSCSGDSAASCAFDLARELGTDPDPGLALAGAASAGVPPEEPPLEAARKQGLTERPGLAIPTADVTAGLAYSGLLHADFSGDETATAAFLAELDFPEEPDADAHRNLASAVALEVAAGASTERATDALADALGPRTSPTAFETIGGYADVLEAAAAMDAAGALAALLGDTDEATLLDHWRNYGAALHDAVADLPAGGGAVELASVDVPPAPVARLGRDFRVDAERLYVAGPDSIALATRKADARSRLESHFPDEQPAGTDTLATVQTTELDPIERAIEAER
ncbi:MAG: hypothetical protein ACOCPV_02510 [Halodesulfurarchaeum sp.]